MRISFAALIAFCLLTYNSEAAIFIVNNTTDSGEGSLREAILQANAAGGGQIVCSNVAGTITLSAKLPAITGNTTIIGPGSGLLTVSGNNLIPIFSMVADATTILRGITIANGRAMGYSWAGFPNGSGISNSGVLSIIDCVVVSNRTVGGFGGGIYNEGSMTIIGCIVSNNVVRGDNGTDGQDGAGGGGAALGGGLYTRMGQVTISNSIFSGNTTRGGDGGGGRKFSGDGRGGGANGGVRGDHGAAGGYGGGGGGARLYEGGNGGFGGGGGGGSGVLCNGPGGFAGLGGGRGGSAFCTGGGGGGGGAFGGGIFVESGRVTIVDTTVVENTAIGGTGGHGGDIGAVAPGEDGSGVGADFFNRNGRILPKLIANTIGGGTVSVNPATEPYLNNSLATVTATARPSWSFLHWLGDSTSTNPIIDITVTRNKCLTAIFATQIEVSVLVDVNPLLPFYPYGTRVRLTALPPEGTYLFGWTGNANGTLNPLDFVVTNATPVISALFATLSTDQFTLNTLATGFGRVVLSPQANYYNQNDTVALMAVPSSGQSFIGWSGDASGTNDFVTLMMDRSKSITANFTKQPLLTSMTCLGIPDSENFQFLISGEAGRECLIEFTTNLVTDATVWTPLATITNVFGTAQFNDSLATNRARSFYRAVVFP